MTTPPADSGKAGKKQFGFELDGIDNTNRIEAPLVAFLEKNGRTRKKGLFG